MVRVLPRKLASLFRHLLETDFCFGVDPVEVFLQPMQADGVLTQAHPSVPSTKLIALHNPLHVLLGVISHLHSLFEEYPLFPNSHNCCVDLLGEIEIHWSCISLHCRSFNTSNSSPQQTL
jgi:hypothetical protein